MRMARAALLPLPLRCGATLLPSCVARSVLGIGVVNP